VEDLAGLEEELSEVFEVGYERHQSFVGVPAIGRMVLLRVTQEF
jgi:hypothetical protein